MSRKVIISSVIFALILSTGLCSSVQALFGSSLSLASPRIIAMGGAYVAVADDANAVFLNPAGLGRQRSNDFSLNHGSLLNDLDQYSFSVDVGLAEYGKLGVGYNVIGTYNIQITDASGNLIGTCEWYNKDIAISYGLQIYDWFLFGLKAHRLSLESKTYCSSGESFSLEDAEGEGYGLDIGILLRPFKDFYVGLSIGDFYTTNLKRNSGVSDKIPTSAVLGVAYQPIKDRVLLAMDLQCDNTEQNIDVDSISIGSEFFLAKWFKFRLGVLFSKVDDSNYDGSGSAGLGFNFLDNLQFDYALRRPSDAMTDAHYFSLGARI